MARRPTSKLMNSIMQKMTNAALGIDREGTVIIFNDEAEKLFGSNKEAVIGKKIWDVMEITDFTRTLISMIKDSEPSPMEQIIPFPDNRIFLVKVHPVKNTDGRIIGAAAILEDLTSIHKMEKTINDFVAVVSHELKTPLTSIKGFVETLLEGAVNNPEVTKRFLQVINEETNRMTRLVINLLDLTKAMRENGNEEENAPINSAKLIKHVAGLFKHIAEEKGVDLIISVPDVLSSIQVNEDKMRQVIINLIDNAIKYTCIKQTGTKREVEIKASSDKDWLYIEIRDTGVGIPTDEMKNIFKKFYRITNGPASQLGGTGLGLSITREIISSYGGKITVESVPDEGTTFKVAMPAA